MLKKRAARQFLLTMICPVGSPASAISHFTANVRAFLFASATTSHLLHLTNMSSQRYSSLGVPGSEAWELNEYESEYR